MTDPPTRPSSGPPASEGPAAPVPGGRPAPAGRPTPAGAADGLFSGPHAAATTCFAAVMFLTGFAALAVVPTLPTAAQDLGRVSLYPLVAGCFVAAGLLGGVLGGHWSDRAGPQRPLAAGMVLSVVTLLLSGAATSIWQLAAGRFLDGLAGGTVAVSINAAIGQAYPDRLRPRVLALMSACWVVPSLVGPPLAGLVAATWSWRAVFLGLAAVTALPALAVVALLRRPSWAAARAVSGAAPPRPALLVACAVSLGAALGQYGASGRDTRHLLTAAGGIALLAVFAPRLLPPGTWRAARGLPATVLLRGLGSGVFFTLEAYVPLLLVTDRQAPPVVIGLGFTGAALAWAASSWLQGRLERWARHRLVVAGALVQTAAVGLAIAGTLPATPAYTAVSAMMVAAVGMGLYVPSVTVLSLTHSPPGRQGYAGSAMQTSQNLGQVTVLGIASGVFSACLGVGASDPVGYGTAFALLFAPCALSVLLASRARGT
ncbi:MFS transporter [Kitasatospora sp. NE20-6]|uniref:MFS transporter n=1 Tax=Kitasatospora sp. NE20-6 TaxID=2859066 RepID=UPI0038B349D0